MRNTAVIFMSDHGMRWGSFRQTYQGRLEDSLPFIFFLFPDWWKQQHPQAWDNLNTNARSLTSPFDLHETLKDILEPRRLVIPTSKVSFSSFLTVQRNYFTDNFFYLFGSYDRKIWALNFSLLSYQDISALDKVSTINHRFLLIINLLRLP